MYWIRTASGTEWHAKPGFAGLSYSRVVFPGSAWKFQIIVEPSDQPQRIRLTYILGRVNVPRGVERWYLKLRNGLGRGPLSTSPRYLVCDFKVRRVSGDSGQAHP